MQRVGKNELDDIELTIEDEYVVCHIHALSEGLKELIRNHLSNICHGKSLASKNLSLHSYKSTLTEFYNRYNRKTDEIKKGMMGELLSHVLIHEYFKSFDVVSPFFNMEEKSQRKGFDLILVSRAEEDIWITEVKSGAIARSGCPDKSTRGFLHTAKRDLKLRLNQGEETFWLNAITTANNAIEDCTDYKDAVITVLAYEGELALNDKADSKDNNVILISVLFHDVSSLFNSEIPKVMANSISEEDIFNKVITFSIQKGTYQNIENFLFQEELNG